MTLRIELSSRLHSDSVGGDSIYNPGFPKHCFHTCAILNKYKPLRNVQIRRVLLPAECMGYTPSSVYARIPKVYARNLIVYARIRGLCDRIHGVYARIPVVYAQYYCII